MNRFPWIAPVYGYLVCVIAVITFIINVSGLVDATFDRANPLSSRNAFGPYGGSLTSFEVFRLTYDEHAMRPTRTAPPAAAVPGDTLTTRELRARYDALRADRIETATFHATQRLVKHGLLILLAIALFVTHWRWLQRCDARVT